MVRKKYVLLTCKVDHFIYQSIEERERGIHVHGSGVTLRENDNVISEFSAAQGDSEDDDWMTQVL